MLSSAQFQGWTQEDPDQLLHNPMGFGAKDDDSQYTYRGPRG